MVIEWLCLVDFVDFVDDGVVNFFCMVFVSRPGQ